VAATRGRVGEADAELVAREAWLYGLEDRISHLKVITDPDGLLVEPLTVRFSPNIPKGSSRSSVCFHQS
jgi:hypothetical protein